MTKPQPRQREKLTTEIERCPLCHSFPCIATHPNATLDANPLWLAGCSNVDCFNGFIALAYNIYDAIEQWNAIAPLIGRLK